MQVEPAESLVVQDLPTNRTNRHTNRHTNCARRSGNSYKPYKPLRFGVLESKPPWCTVCTVCTNSLGAMHGLYDGLYDGLYGLYKAPARQAIQRARLACRK